MRSSFLRSALVLACLLVFSSNSWGQSFPESELLSVRLTLHPNSIAVGDFNRDGNLDMAVTGCNASDPVVCYDQTQPPPQTFNFIYIFLGDGKGNFQFKGRHWAWAPAGITAADMNRDGRLDLVAARPGPGSSAILLGAGDGTFGPPSFFVPGYDPSTLAPGTPVIGDFNRDGSPDAAFPVGTNDTVGLGLGNKTGNLDLGGVFWGGPGPVSAVAADFDQNGTLDLAVADFNSTAVGLLLGSGYGYFWGPTFFQTGATWPNTIVTADFNRDGKDDVAVIDLVTLDAPGTGRAAVLLGDGAGSFSEPILTTEAFNTPSANGASWREMMAVGDFNHDAVPDLALVEQESNTVAVLIGDGTGHMRLAKRLRVGRQPIVVRVADFNNDGRDDLAVANYGSNNISILLNIAQ